MKTKCLICHQSLGKRVCKFKKNSAVICPTCCVSIRDYECGECHYYKASREYMSSSMKKMEPIKKNKKEFIIEINEKVENVVDRALELIEKGLISESEAIIRNLMKEYPNYHKVQFAMGAVHISKKQIDEAIGYFKKAVEIFPFFVEAHYNLACAYQSKMDIKNMIRHYQQVVECSSSEDEIYRRADKFLRGLSKTIKETDKVNLEDYIKALDFFQQGVEQMIQQQWEKAVFYFEKSIMINPNSPPPYGNMGICLARLGQRKKALEALDKALEIDPHYELASVNRVIIESLQEGERLESKKQRVVQYYKDFPKNNKSYIQTLLDEITK